jgi:hypothetical protein
MKAMNKAKANLKGTVITAYLKVAKIDSQKDLS